MGPVTFATDNNIRSGAVSDREAEAGILPSHGISLDVPGYDGAEGGRPALIQHMTMPAYQSPLRHHRRNFSHHREVKETLNARSEYTNSQDDGKFQHHINQYIIKDEIGRGSFGAVHLAVDQYGQQFAVKEFSKARLRKRAQSNILRRPFGARRPGHLAAGGGFNAPLHRHSSSDAQDAEQQANPLYLIKEEIAIMKKLNHPNLVSLIEVLDDPEEDSLYMVLEMCKKGVIMKVGIDELADPYSSESCRCWFRDMILGIEYLHAQGVVHRDIKPDNLLLTEDDVLKIVDFGVSEMFEKASDMMTAKSAGSPAFLPPELCIARHGDISGRAADIWSMGISLYCLKYGRIPFERSGVLELYEAIKNDKVEYKHDNEPEFQDLMERILEKDPKKRINMDELREHPWVTKNGTDPLLSKEENCANLIEPPTKMEVNHAITGNFKNLMVVMRAVNKFKSLLSKSRPSLMAQILGNDVRIVQPPGSMHEAKHELRATHINNADDSLLKRSRSADLDDRRAVEGALATEGIHHTILPPDILEPLHPVNRVDSGLTTQSDSSNSGDTLSGKPTALHITTDTSSSPSQQDTPRSHSAGEKGHAHDPMDHELLFLGIGIGSDNDDGSLEPPAFPVMAESPTAAEFNIYDTAYQKEVERIRKAQGHRATVFLTRRVDTKREYLADEHMVNTPSSEEIEGTPQEGWKGVLDTAREKHSPTHEHAHLEKLAAIVAGEAKSDNECRTKSDKGSETGGEAGNMLTNVIHKLMDIKRESVGK